MGNCFETCAVRQENGEEDKASVEAAAAAAACPRKINGGLKVKILLTRGELEWLMLQLKEKGDRKLEDVLMEIGKEREREEEGKYQGWRPTLESIMEIPEVQGFDNNIDH